MDYQTQRKSFTAIAVIIVPHLKTILYAPVWYAMAKYKVVKYYLN